MKIFGKELTFNGNKVYHTGNKPTASEIGAAASSHTHNYAGSSSAGGAANSALTATKATQDSAGQQINTTYIKGLSVSGKTITYTKGDGTTGTITTQDTNTTYSTGTASTSGLTKLYTGTGTATDGTMTQAAINTALSGKAASSHTHNYAGSSSAGGAANSANTLATARKINGTSFDGSANITTANWGTARIITIGSTGKSVNGSGSVSWTLREIGAAPASHGRHMPDTCETITDWNNATKNGWYMGNNATNSPTANAWYFGEVIAHNANYVVQTVYQFTASTDAKAIPKYIRAKMNGTWGAWTNVTVAKAVPSNAVFTDTNTWRGVQDNLTSTAKDQSLSANQGKVLKGLIDGKAASNHTHSYLPLSGGTLTGNINFNMHGRNSTVLNIFGGDANGHQVRLGGGAATIVGAGESGAALESIVGTAEALSLSSDQQIDFYTNCNTIDNRVKATLNNSLHFFPSVNATGSIGTSSYKWNTMYANTFYGALSGNASTATTLKTARTINGTSFNGSANITTANWGTSRTITIGKTGKSVNGAGNVSWSLAEIGAAASSHTHSYLPLSGGAVTGNIVPNGAYNLGSQSNQWVDVFIRGSFINNVAGRGEGYFAFSNGSQFATAIYGKENGEIGIYDSLRSRHVFMYTFQNNNFTLTFSNNLKPSASNAFDLGDSSARWRTVYAINGFNTSDKNHKENIEYIPDNIKCISNDTTKNSKITYEDMYNFYKDIKLATYNYKNQEHKEFGFIAQDISETKVGSQIALNLEDGYMYSVGSYISSVAGALKQCINEIELLKEINKELHEEIYTLKNEL